ncbi:MAG: hypothetical protein LIV24_05925 [Eubacterium sp.]|nr:hypothetical protein [Eubacterium sp.]
MKKDRDIREWYRLDNAAKLIPSTMNGADTRVFRLVCELKEEVDPEVLQQALEETLQEFPYMNCCLRKGIFWYYMDELPGCEEVRPENIPALRALYIPGKKNFLYRVSYFHKRINVEIFHVLSDGTGGYMFIQSLVAAYLVRKHQLDRSLIRIDQASVTEKQTDAFSKYYEKKECRKRNYLKEMFPVKAYQIRGIQDPNLEEHLLEGTVSVQDVMKVAHAHQATVGILVTSLWIEAIIREMKRSEYNRPVVVSVPVNLRQFFPSETSRNFFGVIQVTYYAKDYDGTLQSIIDPVRREFDRQLTEENVRKTMNSYSALEHNLAVRVIPLFFKNIALQGIAFRMNTGVTTSVSNVGRVKLPDELTGYIEKFASFMSCKTIFLCISSFGDHMVFGIVSCFERHPVSMHFFRRLVQLGVPVEIASNDCDEGV